MVKDRDFYQTMFKIALPAAFQSMISFLVVVVDAIMVSSIPNGVEAQAAVSQVNSVTAFYTATLVGFVGGASVLISQYWGRRDINRIKAIFAMMLKICIGIAALFFIPAALFPRQVVGIVIGESELRVTSLALSYFRIACFAWLPYAISQGLVLMLRSIEVVKITLIITAVTLITNIGLNYILIFGRFGFPAMGVVGAAVSTVIVRCIELIIVLYYAFCVQKVVPLKATDLVRSERWLYKDYIRFGLPVGITDMQWSLIGMLKAAIIGQLGAAFMAANSIANSIAGLGMLFTFALSGGACVVVGKAVGAGDYAWAREYSKTIQIMFAGIGILTAGIVFMLRIPFTLLHGSSSDPEVYALSLQMIALLAVTMIGTSYHASCFVGINRGAGDSRFVAMVDMICGWLVVLPITMLAAFVWQLPLPLVFLATRVDQLFKWIIAFFRLRGDKWIKNVTRPG